MNQIVAVPEGWRETVYPALALLKDELHACGSYVKAPDPKPLLEKSIHACIEAARQIYPLIGSGIAVPGLSPMHLYIGETSHPVKVKIGVSSNVDNREKQIKTALKGSGQHQGFTMLSRGFGFSADVRKAESRLKKKFAGQKISGEWFTPSAELQSAFEEECSLLASQYSGRVVKLDAEAQIRGCYGPTLFFYAKDPEHEHFMNLANLVSGWLDCFSQLGQRRAQLVALGGAV